MVWLQIYVGPETLFISTWPLTSDTYTSGHERQDDPSNRLLRLLGNWVANVALLLSIFDRGLTDLKNVILRHSDNSHDHARLLHMSCLGLHTNPLYS